MAEKIGYGNEHRLDKLFELLPAYAQTNILSNDNINDFLEALSYVSNNFVEWRYYYETNDVLRVLGKNVKIDDSVGTNLLFLKNVSNRISIILKDKRCYR